MSNYVINIKDILLTLNQATLTMSNLDYDVDEIFKMLIDDFSNGEWRTHTLRKLSIRVGPTGEEDSKILRRAFFSIWPDVIDRVERLNIAIPDNIVTFDGIKAGALLLSTKPRVQDKTS